MSAPATNMLGLADEKTTALTLSLVSISFFHRTLASSARAKEMVLTLLGQSNRTIATPSGVSSTF